jgi:hypothetical protein
LQGIREVQVGESGCLFGGIMGHGGAW